MNKWLPISAVRNAPHGFHIPLAKINIPSICSSLVKLIFHNLFQYGALFVS